MRRIIVLGLLILIMSISMAAAKEVVYGEGVGEGDFTKVSTILEKPDSFLGKTLRVKGIAVGVCEHRGCWLNLASDKEGETIRIKVADGVIVFPKEILGEVVTVEGVFTSNTLEATQKKCDRAKEGENVQCVTTYQITGSGAVVDY
jgi:Domain of unknown function (DUF4920)